MVLLSLSLAACVRDATPDADRPRAFVPYLAGEFTHVYTPPGTRYLNDHTLVRARDGTWHLYGITHDSRVAPFLERSFLHAVSHGTVLGPWEPRDDVLTVDKPRNERALWAPFVFEDGGGYTMVYAAGTLHDETPERTLRTATSTDLVTFTRRESTSDATVRPPGGRDPMMLRDGDAWLLYSVGVDAHEHGQILVSRTHDPDDARGWSEPVAVLTDPVASFGWGNLESPFVVKHAGLFYLFVTRTDDADTDYARTVVFRSSDPTHFGWWPVTEIRAHAAEIVHDPDGRWWITSAGWTEYVGEVNRGLLVARLAWAPVD